jgi:hydrogenase maturation protease
MDAELPMVTLRRGAVYLPADLAERYFAGIEGVILLWRDGHVVVMPVRHLAGGGYLLKQRNRQGDRVIHAADFFADHGLDGQSERHVPAVWRQNLAGLELEL